MRPYRSKKFIHLPNNFITVVDETSDDDEDIMFKKRRHIGIVVPSSQPVSEDEEIRIQTLMIELTQCFQVLPSLPSLLIPQAWLIVGEVPNNQREYLKQFQIFEDKNEANECSFIYALSQSGIPESILTEMKSHLKSQFPQELFDLCKQANINVALRKYKKKPDGSISSISVKLEFQKNGMKYIYLGSPAVTASFIVGLILIDNHYMIRPTDTNAIQKIIIMINSGKIIPYN